MPKSYSSKEIIQIIEADGWYLDEIKGSHHHFLHPTKKGKATLPHSKKDILLDTKKSIEKQTGLKFK